MTTKSNPKKGNVNSIAKKATVGKDHTSKDVDLSNAKISYCIRHKKVLEPLLNPPAEPHVSTHEEKFNYSHGSQKMKLIPKTILSKCERPKKCVWFTFRHSDYIDTGILAEEFSGDEPGDIPMKGELLVVFKKHNNKIIPLVGVQCLFAECAGGNYYVFRFVRSGKKYFVDFKDVLKIYIIRWSGKGGD